MKINRDGWMNDQDLVEEWLSQNNGYSCNHGIESKIENLKRNMASILLELNREKVLEICEDK